jgi:hypothetical protein
MGLSDFLKEHIGTTVEKKAGPLWTICSNGRRLSINSLFLRDETEGALVEELETLFADGHLPLAANEVP